MILLIYFLSLAVFGIVEIVLQLRFSNLKFDRKDKSLLSIMLPFYLSVYLAPVENVLLKPGYLNYLIITGFIILITGILIRIIALITLKANFSPVIEAKETGYLVVTGIYKFIRHPLYLGVLFISISGSLVFSCIFNWLFVLLTFIGVLSRIMKEELFLSEKFSEYPEYKKRSWKLVPFIY